MRRVSSENEDEIKRVETPDILNDSFVTSQQEYSPKVEIRNGRSPDDEGNDRNSPDGVESRTLSPVGIRHIYIYSLLDNFYQSIYFLLLLRHYVFFSSILVIFFVVFIYKGL